MVRATIAGDREEQDDNELPLVLPLLSGMLGGIECRWKEFRRRGGVRARLLATALARSAIRASRVVREGIVCLISFGIDEGDICLLVGWLCLLW